jgi:hypothetical protein
MLRQETVVPEILEVIKELQSDLLFKDHVLVGGTALTLQLGHRTSRTEPRDFIDMAYLLQEISLKKNFELYKEIFENYQPLSFLLRDLLFLCVLCEEIFE